LQTENAKNNEKINEIKIANLGLEKEVGGFRFIAEAFGMELKNVVKFFIFLIVIVFDPLAVALIIAFNGLILPKKKKQKEYIVDIMQNDEKLGLYEVYGDNIINENKENENYKENEDSIVRIPIDLDGDGTVDGYDTNADGLIDEFTPKSSGRAREIQHKLPYYARTDFDWNDKSKWINDQNAVNFWLKYKKQQEEDLIKTY
jgi:hypothetical protein